MLQIPRFKLTNVKAPNSDGAIRNNIKRNTDNTARQPKDMSSNHSCLGLFSPTSTFMLVTIVTSVPLNLSTPHS